ncbi:FAD-dependent oxidoreductase [Actinocorallia sp. A-T 12471]|uniref:NAD(P)/FAD-dependent oxidoreductase n=1 Tax=Actinocorallia sp. A-T 12471 TaxID=3089813 RepID=UPI0029CD8A4A|nr:FAD-dependent oxidoreductase [Actinocorallia sp. A-T 12471]MDX6744788.1 FAD-dependent oxidoreductase [Actinocorallia sp. A-T 12471]
MTVSALTPTVFWTDRPGRPGPFPALTGSATADLVVVGGGYTGLWAAILAKEENPGCDVLLLESATLGFGGSGRNGGFISDSLTHGLSHGVSLWEKEMPELIRLGRENLAEFAATLDRHGLDAGLHLSGKTTIAVAPHQVGELRALEKLHLDYGDDAVWLDAAEMRADVDSPTYLGGLRVRNTGGLVDPGRLVDALTELAIRLGVRVHERTAVLDFTRTPSGVAVTTDKGSVLAGQALIATNAYPAPLRRLRHLVLPVWDYVLVTEPLTPSQLASLGWRERQGLTDAGNQFHYYRLTSDDRILWGGYDAIYHRGGGTGEELASRDSSHELLARHFFTTFPQLEGLKFTHRWGGAIDSTSRFTATFGTALGGRVGYAVGYTGLGVGASRFGAATALDLLARRDTPRTRLEMVRRPPIPFPPEPLRWPVVEYTRRQIARADEREGRRGPWLALLDRFGVGFNS